VRSSAAKCLLNLGKSCHAVVVSLDLTWDLDIIINAYEEGVASRGSPRVPA
jgi:hypothetical protein